MKKCLLPLYVRVGIFLLSKRKVWEEFYSKGNLKPKKASLEFFSSYYICIVDWFKTGGFFSFIKSLVTLQIYFFMQNESFLRSIRIY